MITIAQQSLADAGGERDAEVRAQTGRG